MLDEFLDGLCLLAGVAEEGIEHLLESPLSPMVILRVAGAHLAVPVEGETNLVELLAVAVDVGNGSDLWVLTSLDGILLCWQTIGVISHGVQHVISVESLVAGIDVAGDIAQRMAHVQTSSRWIGEHVEHVEFLLVFILRHLVGLVLYPHLVPFLLDFSEVVFHCLYLVFILFLPIYK